MRGNLRTRNMKGDRAINLFAEVLFALIVLAFTHFVAIISFWCHIKGIYFSFVCASLPRVRYKSEWESIKKRGGGINQARAKEMIFIKGSNRIVNFSTIQCFIYPQKNLLPKLPLSYSLTIMLICMSNVDNIVQA